MPTAPEFPQSPQEEDDLVHASIDKNGRLRIDPDILDGLGWIREPSLAATYELVDAGRIRLWPGPVYDAAFAKVAGDVDAMRRLRRILRRGSWEGSNRLNALPTSVRVHILETGAVNGLVFIRALGNCLEILGDAHRLRGLSDDRAEIADTDALPAVIP